MKRSPSPALRWGSIAVVLVLATLFSAAGCGGAPAANIASDAKVAGMAEPASPPRDLGEAEAQFASAERSVFGAFGSDKPEAQYRAPQGQFAQPPPGQHAQPVSPSATTSAAETSPPPPPTPDDQRAGPREAEAKAAMGGATAQSDSLSSSPCETACRALASMNRSATHICSLAGEDSDHCNNARERVRMATERVRQSCSECAG